MSIYSVIHLRYASLGLSYSLKGFHGQRHICKNRGRALRMVKLCFLMSISNFLALIMWLGRLQKQKKLQTSHYDSEKKGWNWNKYLHSTRKSIQLWRALLIMATVVSSLALRSTIFSKKSETLSWRQ